MPYSVDLRERVISRVEGGMNKASVCRLFNVGRETVYRWLRLKESQGDLTPKTGFQKGHSHGIKDLTKFQGYVDRHADWTQEELAEHFSVGSSTIGRALKKIGYTRKKRVRPMLSAVKRKGKNF